MKTLLACKLAPGCRQKAMLGSKPRAMVIEAAYQKGLVLHLCIHLHYFFIALKNACQRSAPFLPLKLFFQAVVVVLVFIF